MRAKTAKLTSRTATVTALMAAGLASGTAARAATPEVVPVACSAAALAAAISNAGDDATLTLTVGCTYRLTAGLPAISGSESDDLTIAGHGATLQRSTAPGTPQFAIIQVDSGGLTVSDLNFRNGVPAINFLGTAALTINGGLFSGNKGAGAITDTSPGAGPVVNDATFTGNTTTGSGGAIYDNPDTEGAIVTNSTFYGNTAAGSGGAILDTAQGMFSGDVVKDNSAGGEGGGIADADDSSVENCKISGNHAGAGGGLMLGGFAPVMVTGTSIEGNTAEDGGGIYDPGLEYENNAQLTDDKITGNHASADGGGIYIGNAGTSQGILNLAQTRILHNDADSLGGGIYSAGAVAAAHSTISHNTAHGGGGIYQATEGDGNGVVLTNSAVLHNTPDNCEPPGTIPGCNG